MAAADGSLFFAIALVCAWMLSRSFQGIEGDARIYMARVLADLHPQTIGRDLMFVYDEQSRYSIYFLVADRLTAMVNPANAALILALVNLVWLWAAYGFVGLFAKGHARLSILMIAALVPCTYGSHNLLHFAEQYAIPRPLAEACVLAGLTALLAERFWVAFWLLALAVLLHPIMALPGVAILALELCLRDRRWIALGCLLALGGVVASLAGAPLFNRIWVMVDPQWLGLLRDRNPYLFPSLWPLETYGLLALQLVTICIAAQLAVQGRVRTVFFAAAGLGVAGVLISLLFGDLLPVLLIVQVQLWRATWLVSALSAISLGLCLFTLPQRDTRYALACACLLLGWLFANQPLVTLSCTCAAALCSMFLSARFSPTPLVMKVIWALVLLLGLMGKLGPLAAFVAYVRTAPTDAHVNFFSLWNIFILSIPLGLIAALWALRPNLMTTPITAAFAAVMVLGVALLWDDRAELRKQADAASFPVAALLPADQSEVLWIGGPDPWALIDHPSWGSFIQGSGMVFSRPLAMLWRDRMSHLISLGMAPKNLLAPWTIPVSETPVKVTRDSVDRLCAAPDAPSTIVAPLEEGMVPPEDLAYRVWRPSAPDFRVVQTGAMVHWYRIVAHIVISCAGHDPQHKAL